ncbi:MAG: hypothetical protein WKG06_40365 [Segetibacter sp.]
MINIQIILTENYLILTPTPLMLQGWKRLGVREKTISTIQNFLAKGYTVQATGGYKKIYGLRQEDAERLIPYIHISQKESSSKWFFC